MFEVVNNRLLLTAWSIQPETEQTPMGITLNSTKTTRTYLVTDKPLITMTTYSNRLRVGSPYRIESRPEVKRVFRPSAISVTFVGQQWEKAHIVGLTGGGRSYKNREDLPGWAVPLTYWENENIEERSVMPENEAVKKGAAWLDIVRPGWFKKSRFDLDRHDVAEYNRCPLAQAFGDDFDIIIGYIIPVILGITDEAKIESWEESHGFGGESNWDELTKTWKKGVKKRRKENKKKKVPCDAT